MNDQELFDRQMPIVLQEQSVISTEIKFSKDHIEEATENVNFNLNDNEKQMLMSTEVKLDEEKVRFDSSVPEFSNNHDTVLADETNNDKISNDTQDSLIELQNQQNEILTYDWTTPKLICKASKEFASTDNYENFTKGCQWAPDGTCVLVPSEDYRFRLFDLPKELYNGTLPENFEISDFKSSLSIKEGGTIYDFCWFPHMSSWEPSTCCFLSTSQGSPVHLWDAFTGHLRASYRAYNQVDEVEAAISIQFTNGGNQIWTGFKNALRTFDTNNPGRQTSTIYLKKDFPNMSGMVSCIRENPSMAGLIGFGTYSKNIGLYKDGPLCSFKTSSGVTQIEFSPCGTKLYSAVRRSGEFLCWDLRNPGSVLYSLKNRQSDTNQRIQFSLSFSGNEIVSGGTDGALKIWKIPYDVEEELELDPAYKLQMTKDCINGVQLHKSLPLVAVATGTRICDKELDKFRDNGLRFYWLDSR
ncbi:hypothetical protein TKK_0005433 [Trichogramma kaykai]|uniref:WD repeat-containing protein 79 n=1 Tax=Trichogramma kaykai TaxID=54128 RepID=A0ABD2XIU1_9HYME